MGKIPQSLKQEKNLFLLLFLLFFCFIWKKTGRLRDGCSWLDSSDPEVISRFTTDFSKVTFTRSFLSRSFMYFLPSSEILPWFFSVFCFVFFFLFQQPIISSEVKLPFSIWPSDLLSSNTLPSSMFLKPSSSFLEITLFFPLFSHLFFSIFLTFPSVRLCLPSVFSVSFPWVSLAFPPSSWRSSIRVRFLLISSKSRSEILLRQLRSGPDAVMILWWVYSTWCSPMIWGNRNVDFWPTSALVLYGDFFFLFAVPHRGDTTLCGHQLPSLSPPPSPPGPLELLRLYSLLSIYSVAAPPPSAEKRYGLMWS